MAIEIVDFPIKNGGSFHSYVSLPEGKNHGVSGFVPIFSLLFASHGVGPGQRLCAAGADGCRSHLGGRSRGGQLRGSATRQRRGRSGFGDGRLGPFGAVWGQVLEQEIMLWLVFIMGFVVVSSG